MEIWKSVAVVGCMALTGCVSATGNMPVVPPNNAASVSTAATIQRNVHTGMTNIENPVIMPQGTLLGDKYMIRSWVAPNNPEMNDRFQIQVSAYVTEWKFLDRAYAEGKPLDTMVIDRSIISCAGGCSMSETVGINLTKDEVERYAKCGLSFQISGRRGNVTMTIPAGYFAGALQAHERAKVAA